MISGTNGDKHTGESMCSMCMLKFLGGFLSKSHFCHGNVPRNPSGPSLCVHAAVPTQPPCPWFRVYITHFRILEHPLLPCLGWGELHGALKKKKKKLQFQWQLSLSASALLNLWYKCEATCAGSPVTY